jgi:hypothetical protein
VSGNGSLDLELNTTNSTALSLASRQSGANAPQLVVTYTPQLGMNLLGKVLAALIPVDLQLDDPTTEPTPTASDTPEPPTATPTDIDTPVPSASATPTASDILIPSASATWTATVEQTATNTDIPTIPYTPSSTLPPASTATPTVTNIPTTTWTPTVTNTATVTNTTALTSSLLTYPTEPPPPPLQNAAYLYEGDGNLVKSIVNDTTTYYPSRQYVDIFQGSVETVQKYYSTGSQTIAENTVIVSSGQATLNWILSDQVGSTSVTANADGTFNSEIRYTAFGKIFSQYPFKAT